MVKFKYILNHSINSIVIYTAESSSKRRNSSITLVKIDCYSCKMSSILPTETSFPKRKYSSWKLKLFIQNDNTVPLGICISNHFCSHSSFKSLCPWPKYMLWCTMDNASIVFVLIFFKAATPLEMGSLWGEKPSGHFSSEIEIFYLPPKGRYFVIVLLLPPN